MENAPYAASRLSTSGSAAGSVMWAPERRAEMKWCAAMVGLAISGAAQNLPRSSEPRSEILCAFHGAEDR